MWRALAVVATCRLLIAPHAAPYLTIWSDINSHECSHVVSPALGNLWIGQFGPDCSEQFQGSPSSAPISRE